MSITEFAILVFKSPPDFSDIALRSLLQELSAWQSECSGFPLCFFTNVDEPREVCLVTGWKSVGEHEAWIGGERNQALRRMFEPYVDLPEIRMVHLDADFGVMPIDDAPTHAMAIIERYDGDGARDVRAQDEFSASFVGRDLAREDGDVFVFRFVGMQGDAGALDRTECQDGGPVERWVLKRIKGIEHTNGQ